MTQTDFTGRTLGGYRILRKLGAGGMAVVYKAHEESLNRDVALKVIAEHLSSNEQFIARFKREAQAAAQLTHPNIVQIYAIGEAEGVHYFAMEYVNGRSLAEVIEEEGFLTAGRALPIIAQAAEALAVAHDAGIVHRDIKPANIMIDQAGRVKVADFGIAQMATETRMTQSGMLVGTPEYISPEQCRSEKLDGRSDIYALGVTLYQLLSGQTPFNADTPHGLVMQIVEGPIPEVGELNPTIPTDVQQIVAKMMDTDRNQRFQSAEDLIHAIRAADTQPATGPRPAPPVVAPAPSTTPMAAAGTEPTVAMASGGDPTVAMDGNAPVPTGLDATEAMPEATQPEGQLAEAIPAATEAVADQATEAIPAQQQARAEKPSPATDAYARGRSNNTRTTLIGLAALIVVALALSLLSWQFIGMLGADETPETENTARQAALPNTPAKTAGGNADDANENDAAGSGDAADDGGDRTAESSDAAAGGSSAAGGSDDPPAEEVTATGAGAPATTATTDTTATGTPPATDQQATAQQTPPPADPAAADPAEAEPAFVPPPVNSIVAVTSGEYEYVDMVNAWFEGAFASQQFEVVDFQSSPYGSLAEAARFHVVTTATLIGTQQLEYFGNTQTQYTVGLTTRVTDLSTGVTVVGPETETVRYTSINMEQNLEAASTELARAVARQLRQVIR